MVKLNDIKYPAEPTASRVNIIVNSYGEEEARVISFNTFRDFAVRIEGEYDINDIYGDLSLVSRSVNERYWVSIDKSEAFEDEDGVRVSVQRTTGSFDIDNVLAGADFTPRVPNAEATPEQLWGELLLLSPEERNKRLQGFIDSSQPPLFDYNQKQADIESGKIAELWRFGNSKFSSYSGTYEARRDNIKETWPELAEAVDRLSRVR